MARPNGILSKTDLKYLVQQHPELNITDESFRADTLHLDIDTSEEWTGDINQKRYRLREKIAQALRDFQWIGSEMCFENHDRELIFDDYDDDRSLREGSQRALNFLLRGMYEASDQSFEQILNDAVSTTVVPHTGMVIDNIDISISYRDTNRTTDEIRESFDRTGVLPPEDIGQLVMDGAIEPDELEQFRYDTMIDKAFGGSDSVEGDSTDDAE